MDDLDLSRLLKNWPFEPGNINVRVVGTKDGRQVIQLRVDLGILQMEIEGRPDGQRFHGHDSLLAYHLERIKRAGSAPASDESAPTLDPESEPEFNDLESINDPTGDASAIPFALTPDECREIREEAVQYYHRYVSLFALDDFEGVYRDATHNLQLIELCRRFADNESDQAAMEPLRLHTIMTRTRAQASAAIAAEDSKAALAVIDQGIQELREAADGLELSEEEFEEQEEVQLLRGMRESLIPKLPVSQRSELLDRIKAAVAAENYELAAILRDELRMMGN